MGGCSHSFGVGYHVHLRCRGCRSSYPLPKRVEILSGTFGADAVLLLTKFVFERDPLVVAGTLMHRLKSAMLPPKLLSMPLPPLHLPVSCAPFVQALAPRSYLLNSSSCPPLYPVRWCTCLLRRCYRLQHRSPAAGREILGYAARREWRMCCCLSWWQSLLWSGLPRAAKICSGSSCKCVARDASPHFRSCAPFRTLGALPKGMKCCLFSCFWRRVPVNFGFTLYCLPRAEVMFFIPLGHVLENVGPTFRFH